MKFLKYTMVLSLALSLTGVAQAAKSEVFYEVPFHNVEVRPASKIYVDYQFDAHKQTLVCTDDPDSKAITSTEWVYKDATRKIELPVTLMDDARFEGHFADPSGRLVITNDFFSSASTGSIFVSCEYRNMK